MNGIWGEDVKTVNHAIHDGLIVSDETHITTKVGKWIYCGDEESGIPLPYGNGRYRCSLCNYSDIHAKAQKVPFCWHCGAKMEGTIE